MKKRILFVCHGNICRSPMAEFRMKSLVEAAGMSDLYTIASAATSTEDIGNPVYPPARKELAAHGIGCDGKHARQITLEDYGIYDLIIGMDQANVRNMRRFWGGDPEGKISLLLEHVEANDKAFYGRDVADPWYTGDFKATWEDVDKGCRGLLKEINQL